MNHLSWLHFLAGSESSRYGYGSRRVRCDIVTTGRLRRRRPHNDDDGDEGCGDDSSIPMPRIPPGETIGPDFEQVKRFRCVLSS